MSGARLMIAGGGTGGHLFPGIAIAEAWLRRVPDGEVVFVGTARGLEARIVPERGWPLELVPTRRLKNAGPFERARTLAAMPAAIAKCGAMVRRHEPATVLGVGGYAAGPTVLAAALVGRPCAIAEQNAIPGLTNRILGRVARRVYTAFPEAGAHFAAGKIRPFGNPVRREILEAGNAAAPAGAGRHVFVVGGSQGARFLNETAPPALGAVARAMDGVTVHHQCGRGEAGTIRAAYTAAGLPDVRVESFIDDMGTALAAADLVLARAGATTVAELACMGRPAVFVPFPFAADDHQAANAMSFVAAGAARMVRQDELTPERLAEIVIPLLGDVDRLAEMGHRARARARFGAAADIVDDLLALAGGDRHAARMETT